MIRISLKPIAIIFISFVILLSSVHCITVTIDSANSIQRAFLITHHDLDISTDLLDQAVISSGSIENAGHISGQGSNSQTKLIGNNEQIALGTTSSSGIIESAAKACASDEFISLSQSTSALGESEIETNGIDSSNSASQKAGVLSGDLASSQSISLMDNSITSRQASSIVGIEAYTDVAISSPGETAKATGGLNGIGIVQSQLASDGATVVGNVQAYSLESKAYSAVKTTNDYSYASSDDQLSSNIDSKAVGTMQQSTGDTKTYSSVTNGIIPIPGSWVWNGFGGAIASNPAPAVDDQGRNHVFVKGMDNGLWDNINGDWYSLGGVILSDPYAIKDSQRRLHILAKGADNALWDNILNTATLKANWVSLGGYITSNPAAVRAPGDNGDLKIAVKGGDNALWVRDLNTADNTADMSGAWSGLGGYINSNPSIIYDSQGKLHALAQGGDSSLWDNVDGTWLSRGGIITSDAKAATSPITPDHIYAYVRGSDGSLWSNDLNTADGTSSWRALGGFISAGSSESLGKGNPAPESDSNALIHAFVRGGDGALWDNVYDSYTRSSNWYSLGGKITSDPSAFKDINGKIQTAARGGDYSLVVGSIVGNAAPVGGWNVVQKGNIVEIAYGSGTNYPQYAALYLNSSYFRMNYGPQSGWGTSAILFPSFWENGKLEQGTLSERMAYGWRVEGSDLLIPFTGWISDLFVKGQLRIHPPDNSQLTANVDVSTEGNPELDSRPNEAFKPVMLSSMYISSNEWDAQSAYVGSQTFGFPSSGWVIQPAISGTLFGLNGGTSAWKTNSPTIEVKLNQPLQVTGWVNQSSNSNDDNIGFWAASDSLMKSWQYSITAKKAI